MGTNFNKKLFLVFLKTIPMLISLCYLLNIVFSFIGIYTRVFSIMSGTTIIPLMFLYLSSYVFQFCSYHRMFLHYILCMNIIEYLDSIFVFSITQLDLFISLMIITFIFMIITLYKYLKTKKGGSNG